MTKTITVNLDDIKIDITLDKIIEREVKARVEKEVSKLKVGFQDDLPIVTTSHRRNGNSYRAILYAQLLASGRPDQNIFVLCHDSDNANHMFKKTADLINCSGIGFQAVNTKRMIHLINNSRIFFTTQRNFDDIYFDRGVKNVQVIKDDYN